MASNAQGIRAGRAYVELATNASKLDAGLNAARSKVDSFANAAKTALAGAFAVAAPVALAVKTFAAFDDQMRLVQGVTRSTGEEFAALTERAKELGRTTSWTAAQVAEGMTSLGRAGFQSGEIDASIAAVMDLARATGVEIASASDIASNALRTFNLDASQMTRVCDVLTATANGSAQTIEDLGYALADVAPIAKSTGLTLEDTAKLIGALANFGVKGSAAGTVLKNIQTRLASDAGAQAKYAELGIDTTDAEGNLRKLNDILIDLGVAIQNMPSAEKLATIKTLFGQYGLKGVSITTADFKELNDAIDSAEGTAARVAAAMDDGLGGALRLTSSAIEGLKIAVGEAMVPALQNMAKSTQNAAAWLTQFTNANPGAISSVAVLAVKIGAGAAALYGISKAFSAALIAGRALTSGYSALVKVVNFFVGSTKAAQAAQAAQATQAAALANVQKAVAAVNAATTTSAKAAADAELLFATSQYKSAAAAAANAQATARAKAALVATTAASIAAVAAIGAVAAAYMSWATSADRAANKAKAASDAIAETAQAQEARRGADRELFAELQRLADQQSLTSDQFARAEYIVAELTDRYGDLGLKCDETSRQILGMADAQNRLNEAQKKQNIQTLKDEISTYTDEIDRNNAALERMNTWSGGVGLAIKSGFSADEMLARRQELLDRNRELERLIRQNQNELDLVRNANAPVEQTVEQNVASVPVPTSATYGPTAPERIVEQVEGEISVETSTPEQTTTAQDVAKQTALNFTALDDATGRIDSALARFEDFDAASTGIAAAIEQANATDAESFDFTTAGQILAEPLAAEFGDLIDALGDVGGSVSRSFESSGTFSAFETISDDGAAQLNETKRQTRVLNDVLAEIKRGNEIEDGDLI